MRALSGLTLAALLVLTRVDAARAQWVYPNGVPYGTAYSSPPGAATYSPRPYAFRNEPLASVNRSYLGYSNLIDPSPNPPAPGYVTRYGQAVNQGVIPARGGFRLFGRRRGYPY